MLKKLKLISSIPFLLALSVLAVGCATSPPKMTDAERSQIATTTIQGDEKAVVGILSGFLLSEGFVVEGYDEYTH